MGYLKAAPRNTVHARLNVLVSRTGTWVSVPREIRSSFVYVLIVIVRSPKVVSALQIISICFEFLRAARSS